MKAVLFDLEPAGALEDLGRAAAQAIEKERNRLYYERLNARLRAFAGPLCHVDAVSDADYRAIVAAVRREMGYEA